jgi:hypothetical protein
MRAVAIRTHVQVHGLPLLREPREDDLHVILAWTEDDGYRLSIEGEDEGVQSAATWGEMAEYLGLTFSDLEQALIRAGYPDRYIPADPQAALADPYDVFDRLKHLQPWASWSEILEGVPHELVAVSPGGGEDLLGTLSRDIGARPDDDTEYVTVDSIEGLSALQDILDQLGRRTHVQVAE